MKYKKQLTKKEKEYWHKFHIPNCSNIYTRKVNAVFLNTHNSLKHELKKAETCYEIQQNGGKFITEAQKSKGKIIDIIDLSAQKEIEIIYKHETKEDIEEYRRKGVIPIIIKDTKKRRVHKK